VKYLFVLGKSEENSKESVEDGLKLLILKYLLFQWIEYVQWIYLLSTAKVLNMRIE